MRKKSCGCQPKGCIAPQYRYCGETLNCLDVESGDTFNEIITKIDNLVCTNNFCDLNIELSSQKVIGSNDIVVNVYVTGGSGSYTYKYSNDTTHYPNFGYVLDVLPNLPNGDEVLVVMHDSPSNTFFGHINVEVTDTITGCKSFKSYSLFYVND